MSAAFATRLARSGSRCAVMVVNSAMQLCGRPSARPSRVQYAAQVSGFFSGAICVVSVGRRIFTFDGLMMLW
jgi:hypothetical protein